MTSSTESSCLSRDHQTATIAPVSTASSHGCLGNKLSSASVVGFQPASSMVRTSNHDNSIRAFDGPGTSVKSSLDLEYSVPVTVQSDKKHVNIISSSVTCASYAPLSIQHFCHNEETHSSSSYCGAGQERIGQGNEQNMGDSKDRPLVLDDSDSNFETSHDHIEASPDHVKASHDHIEASLDHNMVSHDHIEVSHDHIEASHDIHMRNNNEHSETLHIHRNSKNEDSKASHDQSKASHDTQNNKHDRQKVASLVVCVLNPYLKKGRIANKVWKIMCLNFAELFLETKF